MNTVYIQDIGSDSLLLIYAGWSTDEEAFSNIKCNGYDIAVVSDYTTLSTPSLRRKYKEVVILAWSLGVKAAEMTASNLPLSLTIAVNGTPQPVNNTLGIPEGIFRSTTENLSEQNLMKFRRRMGAAAMSRGSRTIASLKAELENFSTNIVTDFRWDRAVITRKDLIFPPQNQLNAWNDKAEITITDGMHMPDFQSIVNHFVINKKLVEVRFDRGRKTYCKEADIQQRAARHLFDLWQKHGLKGGQILEIGVGNGLLTDLYAPKLRNTHITLWDIAPAQNKHGIVEQKDAEQELPDVAPDSFDAIVSTSTMQWFNSPAAFMLQCARVLKHEGIAAISTFGPATFRELTEAGVIPLPYLSVDSLLRIIPKEFEILELHSGIITKTFDNPQRVLHHLKATGVNARPTTCGVRELIRRYPRQADGRVALTYEPIYIILRKR